MRIVDLIISIVTMIIVYKLYEKDSVKGAFIFRLAIYLISVIFIKGYNINNAFLIAKLIDNGTLFIVLTFVMVIIEIYVTNLSEYRIAFNSYGHTIVAYIFVCFLIELALNFIFSCGFSLLQLILLGKIY